MTISQANLSILDGALGNVPSTGDQVQAKVGTCTAGTVNTPALVTSPQQAGTLFGTGPLVEAARVALSLPGNGGVIMCKAPSGSSSVGSTTPGGSNAGTGTYAFGGTPNDAYDLKAVLVADGATKAAATAAFQVSIDGGNTYSETLAVPTGGVYTIPGTGVTLTFTDGGSGTSFKAGDTATAAATAPGYTNTELLAAVDAIAAFSADNFLVHAVGQASSISNAFAVAAALSTKLVSLGGAFKYSRGVVELPHDTDTNIIAAAASVVAPRVMAVADFASIAELDGTIRKRHAAWVVTARAGSVRAGEDLGKVRSGPLLSVLGLYRDEEATPALDAARITTLRRITGKSGFYITAPQMLEAIGSDYSLLQFGRIIDIAAKVIHAKASDLLRDDLELDPTTGYIAEDLARAIEKDITDALSAALVQNKNATKCTVAIDRTTNLITTPTINVSYRVIPRGYALQLTGTLALQNPAVSA